MKENVIENIVFYALVTVITFIGLGVIFTSPEKVICEDEEYIYTEKYSLFNRDTVVYKYSKPICYSGVCVAKNKFRTYNVASKTSALFKKVTISYNNKEYTLNDYYLYDNLEIGDACIVIEYFYPYRKTQIELNK